MTLRNFLESFPLAVVGVDREHRVALWNDAAQRLLGWTAAEVAGKCDPSVPSEVAAEHKTMWDAALRGECATQRESERVTRDGALRDVVITTATDGTLALMFIADVTERRAEEDRLAECEAAVRQLSAAMNKIQEEERRRIARELHDELGQLLTSLRLDLNLMRRELRSVPTAALEARLVTMVDLVDLTIKTVRRVARELRPAVLDDCGLRAALEQETTAFAERTGIDVKISICRDELIDSDHATAVFRIVQESLTNVARHSGATQVSVRVEARPGRVEAELRDNGRGITEAQVNSASTLGLLGVRERAYALGGEAVIEAIPGDGTRVFVSLPQ